MKKVMINVDFIDAETGKVRKAGTKVNLTEDRIAEIRAVNPELITVMGTVEEKKGKGSAKGDGTEQDNQGTAQGNGAEQNGQATE